MAAVVATGEDIVALEREEGGRWRGRALARDVSAQCVARGPGETTLWMGTRGRGVHVSRDDGATWEDAGLPADDVFSVAVSAADGAVYAGCEPSMLFRTRDGGASWVELEALRAIPSAPTWSFPPRPWTSHVRWIAPSPSEADLLLAGIELGGVMRSADGGHTWQDHRPGAVRDCHALAWHPDAEGRAYEAGGGGAAFSRDAGETWTPADDGRDRHYVWGLAVDPAEPDRWFVSAAPGPFEAHGARGGSARAAIYRREGDEPWRALDGGLPEPLDALPYALAFAGDTLLAGLGDGALWASEDRGDSWARLVVEGDAPASVAAIAA
jgi:photosystem II stability/assembly factor-like uncharacterized protein